MTLPTGTVTFLFTDIEGSTRRWEQNAQAMRQALACHDMTLRQAIEVNRGCVFKTIGDAFCAVFARAEDAIGACLDAQREMKALRVPEIGQIRVRMALHTGEADERDGDYFGPALNRVARLLAIGHGEQVLVSSATQSIVQRWLPEGLTLRDLGLHQLKDLADTERVFQLSHADLRSDFPPLKSIAGRPNNLPRQLTSFIGREKEIAQLKELLTGDSMLTLTGSGGCGKTRLAIRLGQELLGQFTDGVWFVELAALSNPEQVPQPLIRALGIRETPGKSLLQAVVDHLSFRSTLLIADNCEHVLDAAAKAIGEILHHCPNVRVIATSREALRVDGEVAYRVPSLGLPPAEALDDVSQCESVVLFVQRAKAAKPTFTLTESTARAAASICRRLDGIPLAIELAAARVKVLSVEQINARLDDRFRLLTSGSRSGLERHQTLRAAIAWSYGLLTDDEKRLLRSLAVFSSGWMLDAAVAVHRENADGPALDEFVVLDLLSRLVDKSLVAADEEQDGEVRYRLLDTVRQFALEEAGNAGERDAACDRHLQHFVAIAEQAEEKLLGGEQSRWLHRLADEHDNLLAALHWSRARPQTIELGLRIGGAIRRFWEIRGHCSIGLAALEELIAATDDAQRRPTVAKALLAAATLALSRGEFRRSIDLCTRGLTIAQGLDDPAAFANLYNNLALAHMRLGELAAAQQMHERALEIRRRIDDRRGIAGTQNNLGLLAMERGDWPAARGHLQEALAISRALGIDHFVAATLNNLGSVMCNLNDAAAAEKLFNEVMPINRRLGNRAWEASNYSGLGDVGRLKGSLEEARQLYEKSRAISREIGDIHETCAAIANLAAVAAAQHDHAGAVALLRECVAVGSQLGVKQLLARAAEITGALAAEAGDGPIAARLLAAADTMRKSVPTVLAEIDRPAHDRAVAATIAAIGDESFQRACNQTAAELAQDPSATAIVQEMSKWLSEGRFSSSSGV